MDGEILGIQKPNRNFDMKVAALSIPGAIRIGELVDPMFTLRNIIPEPFDIPDHGGNFTTTAQIIALANNYWWRRTDYEVMSEKQFKSMRRKRAAILGAVSVGLNTIAEHKLGLGRFTTPDSLDFVYGCLGAYLGYKSTTPKLLSENDVSEAREASPDDVRMAYLERKFQDHHRKQKIDQSVGRAFSRLFGIGEPNDRSASMINSRKNRKQLRRVQKSR